MKLFALEDIAFRKVEDPLDVPIDAMPDAVELGFCRCPDCDRGWAVAPRYPFFRPHKDGSKDLRREWRRRNEWKRKGYDHPTFWRTYDTLRMLIARECPKAGFLPPGTSFGLLRLSVDEPADVTQAYDSLVARAAAVAGLRSAGFQLELYPTVEGPSRKNLSSDDHLELFSGDQPYRASGETYFEVYAPPVAHLRLGPTERMCSRCLRFDKALGKWEPEYPIAGDSIPANSPVFRCVERPGVIVATEAFIEALQTMRVGKMQLKEVATE